MFRRLKLNNFTLIIISISLAMDAFAVSISEGIAMKRKSIKYSLIVGLLFGLFQAFMPLIGWEIGKYFYSSIFTFKIDFLSESNFSIIFNTVVSLVSSLLNEK